MNKLVFRDKLFELQQCPIDINYRVKLVRELLDEYELLKERATPKKVVHQYDYLGDYEYSRCPICNNAQNDEYDFCNCGQALSYHKQKGE